MLVALFSLATLCILALLIALALFHVRYRASWNGVWNGLVAGDAPAYSRTGSFRLEAGFPGFMKPLVHGGGEEAAATPQAPAPAAPAPAAPSPEASSYAAQTVRAETAPAPARAPAAEDHDAARDARPSRTGRDPNRWRRALFRVATDATAWTLVRRFALVAARRAQRLLGLRVAITVAHPDPARLGRAAGCWHAVAPLVPLARGITAGFRFQDRHPALGVRAEGAFSALSLLAFGGALVVSFPWIGLGRRAWHGWRNSDLTGWRAWTYAKIQKS